jgi:predicted hydrolase (HD superfamily)
MSRVITRAEAWEILRQYNQEEFHLRHALTEEGVMRWFATERGYGCEVDFWGNVGLLHDLDFERWPEQHCHKVQELMRELDLEERLIRAVASHGYGIVVDIEPQHEMEKILFATDELTGLIGATALIRPSRSVMDLELKSVRKKFKTESFAAGCSRPVIERGAALLGWELDQLIERTILAMRSCEAAINAALP